MDTELRKHILLKNQEKFRTGKVKLPKIRNQIEHQFIDGTPEGYALRILRHYRNICNERWEVSGLSKEEMKIYEMMNETQIERAKKLDKAIKVLEEIIS